jgi:hypothetical protein
MAVPTGHPLFGLACRHTPPAGVPPTEWRNGIPAAHDGIPARRLFVGRPHILGGRGFVAFRPPFSISGSGRLITAIHEGDLDGNPKTEGDPSWLPLLNTPNYAEYPSGANNVSAAMTGILERFFGTDEISFSITSNAPNVVQRTRSYTRTTEAAREVVDARMFPGFHFRFADVEAYQQGTRVAHWVYSKAMRPLPLKRR